MELYSMQGQRIMDLAFIEGEASFNHPLSPGSYILRRAEGPSLRLILTP